MGLAVLPYIQEIIEGRKKVVDFYNKNLDFSKLKTIKLRENTEWNYSYYPILFNTEDALLKAQKKLNEAEIFPRRYFYPSLNTLNYINKTAMPVSESIAARILCLPLYKDLHENDLNQIIKIINSIVLGNE